MKGLYNKIVLGAEGKGEGKLLVFLILEQTLELSWVLEWAKGLKLLHFKVINTDQYYMLLPWLHKWSHVDFCIIQIPEIHWWYEKAEWSNVDLSIMNQKSTSRIGLHPECTIKSFGMEMQRWPNVGLEINQGPIGGKGMHKWSNVILGMNQG